MSQFINGKHFDYSSVEINIDHVNYAGVKSINYDHGLEPGEGRGTRAQVTLRSRGKYSANGSIEIYKMEYQAIISTLGAGGAVGFFEHEFDITVHYSEAPDLPIITDYLNRCRIKKASESPGEDGGLLTVKCDLSILSITPCVPGTTDRLFPVEPGKFIKL